VGNVGDVDVCAIVLQRQRVVEVLRSLGVDRERELLAKVDPSLQRLLYRFVRLETLARTRLDEKRLHHVLDPLRRAQQRLDTRATAPAGDDCQIARPGVARTLAVDDDRDARREVGLADEQLAAPRELDDDGF